MGRLETFQANEKKVNVFLSEMQVSKSYIERIITSRNLYEQSENFMIEDQDICRDFFDSCQDFLDDINDIIDAAESYHQTMLANTSWKDE